MSVGIEESGYGEGSRIIKSPFRMDAIPDVPWHHVVFSQFQTHGSRQAIVDAATGKSYTFTDLLDNIKRFASGLHKLGVKTGDVIAISSPNTIDYPVWVFAGLSVGAIVTTANPTYTKYELAYYLKDSTASCIIASPESLSTVQAVIAELNGQVKHVIADAPGCVSPSSLLATPVLPTWPLSTPSDQVALLPYSSGTTGLPKGVMLTHRNILANFMQSMCPDMLPPADKIPPSPPVFMGMVPFYHSYGLMGLLNYCLSAGGTVVVLSKFKPRVFLAAIEKYKVQILPLVPSLVMFLAKSEMVKEYDLSSVVSVGSGAAPLSVEAAQEFKERLPSVAALTQAFGMTELAAIGLSNSASRTPKPGAVGNLLAGSQGKIVDVSTGEFLGPFKRGELCIRGPQVMKGYWNKPEATKNTIDEEGFLHTGDIAYYDDDGYFFIVDRIKELIKCKGLQVPPAELEAVLLTHPLVEDAGVTGIPHPTAGEVPRAYVVLKPGKSVTADQLKAFVAERVSAYKRLEGGVIILPEIPRSPTGKILRRKLKEMAQSSKL